MTKICSKCKVEKSVEEFYKARSKKDGLQSQCKLCTKGHYENSREERREYAREYRKNNREQCRESVRRSYEKNREERREYARRYHETHDEQIKAYRETHKEERRNYHLKSTYGVTLEEYEDMVVKQDSKCKICGEFWDRLHIDHCHKSGKIRGLLCNPCNRGLGMFKDNIGLLAGAMEYLRSN